MSTRRKATVLVCPLCGGVAFTRGAPDRYDGRVLSVGGSGTWPDELLRQRPVSIPWGMRTFWECADQRCGAAIMVSAQERRR